MEWSGVSLGESEVDCIGVGHGSCSVMLVWVSGRPGLVRVCVVRLSGLSGVATNLGRGKYGESGNGACLGARERARGKRKGREGQGRAGEGRRARGKGRCRASRGRGGRMYCAMSLVMLRSVQSVSQPARPLVTGRRRLKPYCRTCTLLVSASRQATVRTTARDCTGTYTSAHPAVRRDRTTILPVEVGT